MLKALKRVRPFLITYTGLRSLLDRLKYASGRIDASGGSTTTRMADAGLALERSVHYVQQVFADFNRYAQLDPAKVSGRHVAEIGPGDTLALGLLYLSWGASEYTGIDRFYPTRHLEHERRIYLALREALSAEQRQRFDDAVDLSQGVQFNSARIRCNYGVAAEECDRSLAHGSIDLLISRAVIQSIDLDRALPAMHRVLAPGGIMAHKIDFRDLGIFVVNGYHPLEFRTVSDPVYQWMIQGGDHPNRRHIPYYQRQLTQLGFTFQLLRTGIIDPQGVEYWRPLEPHVEQLVAGVHYQNSDVATVESIRPRLTPEFASLSVEDLLTGGIFLIAQKSGARS